MLCLEPYRERHTIELMRIIGFLAVIVLLCLSSSSCLSQDSSSRQPNASPMVTPTPEARSAKRGTSPELEEAMNKGRELLFQKHDATATIQTFNNSTKLNPSYQHNSLL